MAWTDTLKALAPTVATALGGPLAGAAITALGSIFGMSEPTQDKIAKVIQDATMTSEDIAKLRALEMQYTNDEKERDFKYADLVFKDVDSARQREMSVKGNTNAILAYVIISAFIAMVCGTLLGWAKVDSVLAGTLVGYLSAKAEQVLAYYFGSSRSSDRKTELLAQSPAVKGD